ncbi:hypothetical protein QYF36_007052 [Acer negundo]|nr:hypothetical protein QYF36_007052 [Acer negundo]
MAIRGKKEHKIVFILGLALISCVANGAHDHLGSRCLLNNVCTLTSQNLVSSQSLTKAWVQACESPTPAKVVIPPGTFEMSPVVLQGPCKSHVTFEIIGTLKADTNVNAYTERTWFLFEEIEGFEIIGPGTLAQVFGDRANVATTLKCNMELPSVRFPFVGSLGKYSDETNVNRVLVTDCKLTGTTNGARIKTWLASPSLKASSITCQNIVMNMVKNPIIIDQEYVKNFLVELADVDLVYKGGEKVPQKQECVNAKVTFAGKQNPAACRC